MQSKLRIFVINMDKDREKREHIQKLAITNNLKIEFIKAIDGNTLTKSDIKKVYSDKASIKEIGRNLSNGEIGCALSHLSIYKKIVEDEIDYALILEDDVEFNIDYNLLSKIIDTLPLDWECVLFGHHTKRSREIEALASFWYKKEIDNKLNLVRLAEGAFGAYGYLLSKNGAKKGLKYFKIIDRPIDHWTDKRYNLYVISPPIINISDKFLNISSLTNGRNKESINLNRTFFQRLKDGIRIFLYKARLLNIYFLIRNFFLQFKINRKYSR